MPQSIQLRRPVAVSSDQQKGVALIVVLLFLLAITGLTIWAARQSMFGEGIARNQLDQEVAYQAAESALRDAERDLMQITPSILTGASCTRNRSRPPIVSDFTENCPLGLCRREDGTYAISNWSTAVEGSSTASEPWWPVSKGGAWNNSFDNKPNRTGSAIDTGHCSFNGAIPLGTFTGVAAIPGVAQQPEYIIEHFVRASNVTYQPTAVYRVTARGFGYSMRTQVVLQTFFAPLQE
ncbi:pilus assembly PilX family protein [Variovorax sp. HJSM1_2]|uniref:pilus assembly PilX family protein n=1 Tax=Variovorax sp. HJSM1_2 TaxID=3366263 RepID=UPI003BD41986